MKKIFFLIVSVLFLPLAILAQNIRDAEKLVYYERYKSAAQMLDQIVQHEPANPEAWYWLSQTYFDNNDATGWENRLHEVPAEVRDQPWFQVAYGQLLLTQNKKDSAILLFNQAIKETRSKDPGILAAVAKAHITSPAGDANTALDRLNKAIKRDKKNPALYVLKGNAYRKAGNGGEAYKAYSQALAHDPGYAAALYKTGKIFVSQNNPSVYLNYFIQAIEADNKYAPALYDLYYYYYFTDADKAMDYFNRYVANSDHDPENDYRFTDLLYLTKQYEPAIKNARQLLSQPQGDTLTRLYKLMAYSYLGLNDTAQALTSMTNYFEHEADSNLIAKDFETMATLYATVDGREDAVINNYERAAALTKDTATRYSYYRKLANLYKDRKDYANQAYWQGKFYQNNDQASNLDLFNWGVACYNAEQYLQADSIFGRYTEKYPDQGFGYYWRARTNALQDSTMKEGLAIPYYNQLIALIEGKDTLTSTHKKWLIQAYGYKAAWETNEKKDYEAAIENLNKILEIDPDNKDAHRYITILEKKVPDEGEANN